MISISASELVVMRELWKNSAGLTAPELVDAVRLSGECAWDENTIKTLLTRLVKKGAAAASGQKRAYIYRAMIAEDVYREEAGSTFLQQLFHSSPAQMICFFAERGKLNAKEMAQLKKLLEDEESK